MSATSHIYQSLVVNFLIATAKAGAWFFTRSGAMLAETVHSYADCGNQLLLLLGVKRAAQPPDAQHPMGYGRALYFWSFMVALLLFTGGGVVAIYEGIHKVEHPEPVENVGWAYAILAGSLLLEGASTLSNIREIGRRRGAMPFLRFLRESKDSDLIVVFGENAAASLGLLLALLSIVLAEVTGDPHWDGIGSIAVGVVLVAVAVFLAVEVKSLLVGEAADPRIQAAIDDIVAADPDVDRANRVITVQQGPGEVLVAMKLRFRPHLTVEEVADVVNRVEDALRARCPEVRWSFIEPGKDGEA